MRNVISRIQPFLPVKEVQELNRLIGKLPILILSIIIILLSCSSVLANESPVINYAVTEIFVEDRDNEVIWIDYEKAVLDSIDWGVFGSGDSTMYDRAVKEVTDALINSRQIWFRVRVVGEGSERPQIYINYSEALKNGVNLKNIVTYYRLQLNELGSQVTVYFCLIFKERYIVKRVAVFQIYCQDRVDFCL